MKVSLDIGHLVQKQNGHYLENRETGNCVCENARTRVKRIFWRKEWERGRERQREKEEGRVGGREDNTHTHTHALHIRDRGAETGRILLQILFPLGLSTGENKPTRGTANGDLLINYLPRDAHLLSALPPSHSVPSVVVISVEVLPRIPAPRAPGSHTRRVKAHTG